MAYQPSPGRYTYMEYRRCGNSGLKLPAISLGLWHNFGRQDDYERCRNILRTAFDCGINHIDLANNYGPPPGAAEKTFGKILKEDFKSYRDELIISTKAGWPMWPGPYGDFGSKKYLVASLDQSLKRMGLDYVDIFYHHFAVAILSAIILAMKAQKTVEYVITVCRKRCHPFPLKNLMTLLLLFLTIFRKQK